MKKILLLITILFLLSPFATLAQDFCKGDFDYDGDVDADDVTTFLQHFGRNQYNNPCPSDGPARVPKTGQTSSYTTNDDGDLQAGVTWPNPRFTDNLDGTITDNLTGLIWLKDANCIATNYPGFDNDLTAGDGGVTWQHALDFVAGINDGTYPDCGAGNTDWRLPNRNEILTLSDISQFGPTLPLDHPFDNILSGYSWSSSSFVNNTTLAWRISMHYGYVNTGTKLEDGFVWPVRGGH